MVDAAAAVRPRRGCRRRRSGRLGRRLRRCRRSGQRRPLPLARRSRRGAGGGSRRARGTCARSSECRWSRQGRCRRARRHARLTARAAWVRGHPSLVPHGHRARGSLVRAGVAGGRRRPVVRRGGRRAAPLRAERNVVPRSLGSHTDSLRRVAALAAEHGCRRPVALVRRRGRGNTGRPRHLPAIQPRRSRPGMGVRARRPARASPCGARHGVAHACLRGAPAAWAPTRGLGVDAESTTGAVALYERAGMRVLWRWNIWERQG